MDNNLEHVSSDVLIIGAGFAGSLVANLLHRIDPSIEIVVLDKNYPGSHEASYSIPHNIISDLDLGDLAINYINENTYEIDSNDYMTLSKLGESNKGLTTVSYSKLCKTLLEDIPFVKDEFLSFTDLSYSTVLTKKGVIHHPRIIIDATGWESPIRNKMGMQIPTIGAKTVLFKLENCNIENPHRMKLAVGDFASYGFWAEPQDDTTMLVGTGFWDNIQSTNISDQSNLENLLFLYLEKYEDIFAGSSITEKHFAKVSVDPVKDIVINNIICIGESAGMSNPYWTLGAGHIYEMGREIVPIIVKALSKDENKKLQTLEEIQELWNGKIRKYQKNWAAARVIWNQYAEGWQSIFERRAKLDEYLDPQNLVERQDKGSYSTSYAIKMLGWKRILKISKYLIIFKLRMMSDWFYQNYDFKFRDESVFEWDEIRQKSKRIRNNLKITYQLNEEIENLEQKLLSN